MEALTPSAIVRTACVLGHLLSVLVATAGVVFADYAVFAGRRIDAKLLTAASGLVSVALGLLWVTGLMMIWMDTGFDLATIASSSKLLAKLTVASILTLNGALLHQLAFPRLATPQRAPRQAALLPTVLGAVSSASWLFAVFVAASKQLAAGLTYRDYLALYVIVLTLGIAFAVTVVRPKLVDQLRRSATPRRGRESRPADSAPALADTVLDERGLSRQF